MLPEYMLFRTDGHSGTCRGLQHPNAQKTVEGKLTPLIQTSWQKRIWEEVYIPGLKYFAEIVKDAPITIVDGGDLIHGNYHTDDLAIILLREQFDAALQTFEPIYKTFPNVIQTFLCIGTRAHALDEEGTVEYVMRDRLRGGGHNADVLGHGLVVINNTVIDIAHIGPMSGKGYLRGNGVINYLKTNMREEIDMGGCKPPDLYIRGHYHDIAMQSWTLFIQGEAITTTGLVCPPLCSMNGYARGATKSQPYQTIGMVLARLDNGHVDLFPFIKVYDVRECIGERPLTAFYRFRGPGRASGTMDQGVNKN